jgi:predicted transcriptional regulator
MAKTSFTMRIDEGLRDDLQREADAERRSLANLIETVLSDHIDSRKRRRQKRAIETSRENNSLTP